MGSSGQRSISARRAHAHAHEAGVIGLVNAEIGGMVSIDHVLPDRRPGV